MYTSYKVLTEVRSN